ncbi:lysophospholipid acyltransferase family protein [Yoonia sediminilitoris]|uniref:Lyso-ornithine lipid acyltransferase n=1 Tax=Yoonia sediminilitoris TaxID=1286148 RepID=A0A2T6KCM3_9RHOB|nr:lysophospholipid acyltransferase family protein [Yoonia sediminilitoris]PUB12709.1 lyso-ornithine lipid acyltransferase [Yoonia sediminilitoris]RCW94188.1 lyso-ornithine lipid acyltransferase [Yoonia sediminilitoris]
MAESWKGVPEEDLPPITATGWFRVMLRGLTLGTLVFGGLLILLVVRLIEWPLFGQRRPVTPYITQVVCRNSFRILGMGYASQGAPMQGAGAVVANHSSWLDIFALNARKRIYFVAKAEVAGWPAIGWLARATGTVFIKRDRREASAQVQLFRERLAAGHKLLFFPEGTSTDGLRVLPFKPTLFAAFFDPALAPHLQLQAVTVVYTPPEGADLRFYGWWGDMDFAPHLLASLAAAKHGKVTVIYHAPVKLNDFENRKALAKALEDQVRSALPEHGLIQGAEG